MSEAIKPMEILDLILRSFRVFDGFRGPAGHYLWWRTDGEYAPVTLLVNCSDLFCWATADCVKITHENIADLENAVLDMKAIDPEDYDCAHVLFCCRVRKMRPMKNYYKYIHEKFWPLFDACGAERSV